MLDETLRDAQRRMHTAVEVVERELRSVTGPPTRLLQLAGNAEAGGIALDDQHRNSSVPFPAGADGSGVLFRKGKVVKKFRQEKLVEVLLAEVEKFERNRKERNGK